MNDRYDNLQIIPVADRDAGSYPRCVQCCDDPAPRPGATSCGTCGTPMFPALREALSCPHDSGIRALPDLHEIACLACGLRFCFEPGCAAPATVLNADGYAQFCGEHATSPSTLTGSAGTICGAALATLATGPGPGHMKPGRTHADAGHAATTLPHSGLTVPHTGLRVTSYADVPTARGVAFTAVLCNDGEEIGTIEHAGQGGMTTFNPSGGGGHRELTELVEDYAARCSKRGRPVRFEDVIDDLVGEYTEGLVVAEAAERGKGLVRRVEEDHGDDDVTGFLPVSRIRLVEPFRQTLIDILAARPHLDAGPSRWEYWDGQRWVFLTRAAPPSDR